MSHPSPLRGLPASRGVALVVVLALIVLLTGLVLAFFSRSLSERQISNSSASQVKVDLFAQGATATIIGDLKQEIADGSISPAPQFSPAPQTGSSVLYTPNAAATAVPAIAGFTPTYTGTPLQESDGLNNVVKLSRNGVPFYPGGSNYAGIKGISRASTISTTTPSNNGRYVSLSRWNEPLLMQPGTTDYTPTSTAFTNTSAPQWILVARDGSNPGSTANLTFGSSTPSVNNPVQGNTGYVTGRYAYMIYDEGGLLDANVAGYPTDPGAYPSSSPTPSPLPAFPAAKSALAYADLTVQVPADPSKSLVVTAASPHLLTGSQVNALVGWRNYASSQPSGTFPSYSPTQTPATSPLLTPFDLLMINNTNGFLGTSNAGLYKNQSDRMISTRQQLIQLLVGGVGVSPSSLQYLGNFSRGLNQPSYVPVSRVSSTTNPNPRPLILASLQGGNSIGDNYAGAAAQDAFSPSFLTIRAEASFTRYDGSAAFTGEPLVKKRFALQRLAWLTYQGPSALRNASDTDMKLLVGNGISLAYLQAGTSQNIKNYFGLSWNGTEWSYNIHNLGGTTGAIRTLQQVADLKNREPDFFELLKASIDPASQSKGSMAGPADPSPGGNLTPMNFEYERDIALDASIIQIGANIIDQYDVDGFPTRILFDDGHLAPTPYAREFRGIENLPYIYRVRPVGLKARDSIPSSGQDPNTPLPTLFSDSVKSPPQTFFDTGVGVLLMIPDLWNPHDQNSLPGEPRPGETASAGTGFRVIANSATPDALAQNTALSSLLVGGFAHAASQGDFKGNSFDPPAPDGGGEVTTTSVTPNAPGFSRTPTPGGGPGTPMSGSNSGFYHPLTINPANSSILQFNASDPSLFREPTLLAETNVAGTGLKMIISNPDIIGLQNSAGSNVYNLAAGGLMSINSNPYSRAGGTGSSSGLYTGIYLGTYPLSWVGSRYANTSPTNTGWVYTDANIGVSSNPLDGITYDLQYQDQSGNWVTYDEKYVNTNAFWVNPVDGSFLQSRLQDAPSLTFFDPRTSHFGSPPESDIASATAAMNRYRAPTYLGNWLDSANDVSVTERPDYRSGFGLNFRGTYSAPPTQDWGAYTALGWHYTNLGEVTTGNGAWDIFLQTGLFAQNNPYFGSDGFKYALDTVGVGASDPQFYSDADGVVRRAMGGNIPLSNPTNPTSTIGQPLAVASTVSGGKATATAQSQSRPKILNRPFRSVGEMGYAFSGTPWKNLDFATPESGYSELLDVFCVNEDTDANGLVAGRVNLNTRQTKALTAVLAGAYTNEKNGTPTSLAPTDADAVATALTARTAQTPLTNVGDLVGRWIQLQKISNSISYSPALNSNHNIDGAKSYDGFSADLASLASTNALYAPIAAVRETAVRALANAGNTRVWNLMIDVIAQIGRYPTSATTANNFVVEGEQRYWVHVAIDRSTGQVIDSKLEIVKE